MAHIHRLGFMAQLRSDASDYVIRYAGGRVRRHGRGLVFWFNPETASIAEVPMDDREMTLFLGGRSQDFQSVTVQGGIVWQVEDPLRLAERVDFSLDLKTGRPHGEPIERIETRLAGIANQAALQYLGAAPVRALLDAGPEPLRRLLLAALQEDPALAGLGLRIAAVRIDKLSPSSELERALQTPTFEAMQQRADQAMFERRALAVEKERAIAENELANRTELARREAQLIAQEAENGRQRAVGLAEAQQIETLAEAERIRQVETARAEAEAAHVAVFRDLPTAVLMGLAARDFAGKLTRIDHLNVTPDLLAGVLGALGQQPAASLAPRGR